jgi:hypothetical protein
VPLDVRERPKAVVLQLEESVGVVESLRHRVPVPFGRIPRGLLVAIHMVIEPLLPRTL